MAKRHEPYRPISDYGVIGNCHTAALVSSDGSLDWLCLPRFDSPSIFARILDAEQGGSWSVRPVEDHHSQHAYVHETNILQTTFSTKSGQARLIDFMPMQPEAGQFPKRSPGRLVRIIEGIEGSVEFESHCAPRPNYARKSPQLTADGRTLTFSDWIFLGPADWTLDAGSHLATCRVTVEAGKRATFALLYSDTGETKFPGGADQALHDTTTFWRDWVSKCSYQGRYRDAVIRSALALKLLIFGPSGAIVAAPTTSLPEQIGGQRNWDYRFTWIRDASFTLYALLLAGFTDEDVAFFNWIEKTVQLNQSGINVLYPITPEGQTTEEILEHLSGYRDSSPVRIGNAASHQIQTDIYGEVFDALHFAWQAGGFDPSTVWDHFRPLADWVADNWQQPGNGIWEVRGGKRHFVYGKVMCWVALDRAVRIATSLHLPGDHQRWSKERDAIRDQVFEQGWSSRLKAFKQSYEDDRLDAANLQLSIMGFVDGDDPHMVSTIDATLEHLVEDGFCYRYLDAPEGVPGSEGAFILCSFWLIDALILAGRLEEAQSRYEEMLKRASPLGLFSEEIDPSTGTLLGNFPQAFSHIGVISGAVSLAHSGQQGSVSQEHAKQAERAGSGGGGPRKTRSHQNKQVQPAKH